MERNDIIELLRNEKGNLQEKFGLISIGLFGSHAKGTEGPESDVDLLGGCPRIQKMIFMPQHVA